MSVNFTLFEKYCFAEIYLSDLYEFCIWYEFCLNLCGEKSLTLLSHAGLPRIRGGGEGLQVRFSTLNVM